MSLSVALLGNAAAGGLGAGPRLYGGSVEDGAV